MSISGMFFLPKNESSEDDIRIADRANNFEVKHYTTTFLPIILFTNKKINILWNCIIFHKFEVKTCAFLKFLASMRG